MERETTHPEGVEHHPEAASGNDLPVDDSLSSGVTGMARLWLEKAKAQGTGMPEKGSGNAQNPSSGKPFEALVTDA